LKDFENILDKNYTIPIKITIQDKYVVFKLIKNNIEYIEEVLLEDRPFESICLKIFNLLFLEEGNLNYDNIEEKINDFQLILKHLKNEYNQDEEKNFISKVIENRGIKEWRKFLKLNYISYGNLEILIAVALKYAKTIVKVSEILIYILQKKHMNNFEMKFNLNNLINIPENEVVNNFIDLFKNNTEFFYLDFIKGKIKKKLLSPEIILNDINNNQIKNENPSNKRKKKRKKKNKEKYQEKDNNIKNKESQIIEKEKEEGNNINININESEIIEEDNEEKKSSKDIKSENEEHEEIQPNENKESEKGKEEHKESDPKKNNKIELNIKENNSGENSEFMGKEKKDINEETKEISQENLLAKLSILEKEIENQKAMNLRLNNEIENQKSVNIRINDKIENQKNELNKTIESQKKEIEKIKKSSKLESKNMKSKLFSMKGELEKVVADINLFKSRGALKTFIDFFYRGYNLQGAKRYEAKFSEIATILNQYNDIKKNDIEIVDMLRILLKESALKLSLGNFEDHNIDKSKPILSQLFKLIDPKGNYDKVEAKLKAIGGDKIILNSIINKENYYKKYEKNTLIENENKTFAEVTPEKLDSIFIK